MSLHLQQLSLPYPQNYLLYSSFPLLSHLALSPSVINFLLEKRVSKNRPKLPLANQQYHLLRSRVPSTMSHKSTINHFITSPLPSILFFSYPLGNHMELLNDRNYCCYYFLIPRFLECRVKS
jgi:hypothetical protein